MTTEDVDKRRGEYDNFIEGVVLDASFTGVSVQYLVETPWGQELTIFERNVDVICFEAGVGIKIRRRETISGEKLLEIGTDTFTNNSLGIWIFLISLMSGDEPDINIFRTAEGEIEAVKNFQEYAAGGLAYLNERFNEDSVQTPYMFVRKLLDSFSSPGSVGDLAEVEIDFSS
jgi:dnd system-associated protein 4